MTEGYQPWREYPDRDPLAVVWYPCTYGPLDEDAIWGTPRDGAAPAEKDIGLYLHVPLCKGVCRYCPFNKYAWTEALAERFLAAVREEIRHVSERPYFESARVVAGYLGGGTPTSLGARQLARLVEHCRRHFRFAPGAELTVEATPDTLTQEKLRALRDVGVTRLSVGVQSFEPRLLRAMGRADRVHDPRAILELARRIGFDVVTIDLLYRVPGQSLADWESDLREAARLGLDHLSAFSLFIDPGTPLYEAWTGGGVERPGEDLELAMYRMAVEILGDAGLSLYSLYDFARPGKECLHHAVNWQAPQRDYVGLGPGAFSFIGSGGASHITCNLSAMPEYARAVANGRQPVEFGKRLTLEEETSRYLVLGVNFLHVPRAPFRARFGADLADVYGDTIERLLSWDLVALDDDALRLTDRGRIYVANVSKSFFTEENRGKPHVVGVELQRGEGLSLTGLRRDGPSAPAAR